jgi:signal transduction histidine kinase
MTFSLTTIIVVTSNALTAIIAAALLLVVVWAAPNRRMNQLFGVAMGSLAAYSVANAFGRFIDDMGWDPAHATYAAVSLYGLFIISIFWFASEFSQSRTLIARFMRGIGMVMVVTYTLALWSGLLLTDIQPSASNDGSYQGEWTLLGLIVVGTQVIYLAFTALVLYRMKDERGRALWKAPAIVILAIIVSTIIWPLFQIPLQAIILALAALALGLPVLRFELFNPLARLHEGLAATNRELHEMSRLKTQFLRNMSHELRTPLNSIIGYTQLILNGTYGDLNETQEDRLRKVIRNGNNLLSLINDVLDLNRIETGHVELERRVVATMTVLDHVLDNLELMAANKNLTITRAFDGVPAIQADETRLRQIITNIAVNALKFTDKGGITVRASKVDDDYIQIEIADTGIGIPRDMWDAVFEEFRQLDESTTKQHEGTGLGMAICKRLVELHGGSIWLDSKVGEGTTFFVKLPIRAPVDQTVPAAQAATSPAVAAAKA